MDIPISVNETSLKINVEYSLEQPSGGIHFVIPEGDGSLVEVLIIILYNI